MKDGNGNDRDMWVMVDHDGHRTLFRLIEAGNGTDALRLAQELHAPAVVVDMALPDLAALDEMPGERRPLGNSRLILLNVRTVSGDSDRVAVKRSGQVETLNASSVRPRMRHRRGASADAHDAA